MAEFLSFQKKRLLPQASLNAAFTNRNTSRLGSQCRPGGSWSSKHGSQGKAVIRTRHGIIYYKKRKRKLFFFLSKISVQVADLKLLSRRYRCAALGPSPGAGQGHGGPPALSDALAARFGTSPLTIKYIWSPRMLGEATGRLLDFAVAQTPCLLGPDRLAACAGTGCPWPGRGGGIALDTL